MGVNCFRFELFPFPVFVVPGVGRGRGGSRGAAVVCWGGGRGVVLLQKYLGRILKLFAISLVNFYAE